MFKAFIPRSLSSQIGLCLVFAVASVSIGCTVSAESVDKSLVDKTSEQAVKQDERSNSPQNLTKNSSSNNKLRYITGSAADTVRGFYKNLRERRFREAMMMTNLRPAIEGLSDTELKDLSPDFEALAAQVPEEIDINGEIITNNQATVTAKMPTEDPGKVELKSIKLRREKEAWVILTADEKSEEVVKKEGKNYFFSLRILVHQGEAQTMMDRIAKAQMVYSMQNQGTYTDMKTLVSRELLPADIQTAESTGYNFSIKLTDNGKKYFATAEPAVYGKSGKLSYLLEAEGADKKTRYKEQDNKGLPLKK